MKVDDCQTSYGNWMLLKYTRPFWNLPITFLLSSFTDPVSVRTLRWKQTTNRVKKEEKRSTAKGHWIRINTGTKTQLWSDYKLDKVKNTGWNSLVHFGFSDVAWQEQENIHAIKRPLCYASQDLKKAFGRAPWQDDDDWFMKLRSKRMLR